MHISHLPGSMHTDTSLKPFKQTTEDSFGGDQTEWRWVINQGFNRHADGGAFSILSAMLLRRHASNQLKV